MSRTDPATEPLIDPATDPVIDPATDPVIDSTAVQAAYERFADVYDRYWGDVMTAPVLALVARHLESPSPLAPASDPPAGTSHGTQPPAPPPSAPQPPAPTEGESPPRAPRSLRLLDLCCGSGQLAAGLLARGHDVIGVDASPRLLSHARRRAPAATFRQADVRAFVLDAPVDGAVCAFDSLNHMPDLAALSEAFARVFDALRPGGVFLFDLNTATGFRERFDDDFAITEDDLVLTVEGDFEPPIGRYTITWFAPHAETDGAWRREEITLLQRCFPTPDVLAALGRAGFEAPRTLDAVTEADMPAHVGRLFFLARRPS